MNTRQPATNYQNVAREAGEARFARRIAGCLSESAQAAPADIAERLRFAREGALARARTARPAQTVHAVGGARGGAAVLGLGGAGSRWWLPIASALPLVLLVGGLILIQDGQASAQISTAAEVDAALLGDDLPITAYRDPGFAEFLKSSPAE